MKKGAPTKLIKVDSDKKRFVVEGFKNSAQKREQEEQELKREQEEQALKEEPKKQSKFKQVYNKRVRPEFQQLKQSLDRAADFTFRNPLKALVVSSVVMFGAVGAAKTVNQTPEERGNQSIPGAFINNTAESVGEFAGKVFSAFSRGFSKAVSPELQHQYDERVNSYPSEPFVLPTKQPLPSSHPIFTSPDREGF